MKSHQAVHDLLRSYDRDHDFLNLDSAVNLTLSNSLSASRWRFCISSKLSSFWILRSFSYRSVSTSSLCSTAELRSRSFTQAFSNSDAAKLQATLVPLALVARPHGSRARWSLDCAREVFGVGVCGDSKYRTGGQQCNLLRSAGIESDAPKHAHV